MNKNEILNDPCPNCDVAGQIHLISRDMEISVRAMQFTVQSEAFHCDACKAEFEVAGGPDALAAAYRMYRGAAGLIQPEQLKAWRKDLDLTQAELALLLGWSTATVSRYENGALQDEAHDRAMRAAMTPEGLAELVSAANGLSAETRELLSTKTSKILGSAKHLASVVSSRIASHSDTAIYWHKVVEAVVFHCSGSNVPRTKLNKLLFYTDFLHLKYFSSSLTGLPYVRLPRGPVPDEYELIFATLQAQKSIDIIETEIGENVAYLHSARRAPDITVFSSTELQVLAKVRAVFENVNATAISELSHEEDAWTKTATGERIREAYAATLSLSL